MYICVCMYVCIYSLQLLSAIQTEGFRLSASAPHRYVPPSAAASLAAPQRWRWGASKAGPPWEKMAKKLGKSWESSTKNGKFTKKAWNFSNDAGNKSKITATPRNGGHFNRKIWTRTMAWDLPAKSWSPEGKLKFGANQKVKEGLASKSWLLTNHKVFEPGPAWPEACLSEAKKWWTAA